MCGVGAVSCQGFLVGGSCHCDLVGGVGCLLWSAMKCILVRFGVSMRLAWLWAVHLLKFRVVFLFCWRISFVCLALELVGS